MRKLIISIAIILGGFMLQPAIAQNRDKVNIVKQPIWGPVGYDYVEYYYIPEVDAYYNVPKQKYVYMEKGKWVTRSNLPRQYRGHDMYHTTKFVINEPRPYLQHQKYKSIYNSEGGQRKQLSIRDSRDSKYYENRNHPEHSKWKNKNKKHNSLWNSRKGKK